jgi:elongation factor G
MKILKVGILKSILMKLFYFNFVLGLIDIVNLESILYVDNKGKKFVRQKLNESSGRLWENALDLRRSIVDTLSEHDDNLANIIIQSDSLDSIDSAILKESIRKTTLNMKVYPVLCGSSYKNMGVQMLMDGIIDYLPSPIERNLVFKCFDNDLCARAFKVQHDDQRGVLTYFRIYSGEMNKNQKIFNIPKQKSEQVIDISFAN